MSILVSGVSGQDGSYLAESLLARPPEGGDGRPLRTIGVVKPGDPIPAYVAGLQRKGLGLAACDISDSGAWRRLLRELAPQRVYHCAALSLPAQVNESARLAEQVNVASAVALLDWQAKDAHRARVLLVSSSSVYGRPSVAPQDEDTPAVPVDEYGRQKQRLRELAREAREAGFYTACAIPFNHESPRHGEDFVLPKICRGAARIKLGRQDLLRLGDLSAQRDWGYAPEYAQGLRWFLEAQDPIEAVLATGEAHSVGEALGQAFSLLGLDPERQAAWDAALMRPNDFSASVGDASRAKRELGWSPKTRFAELVPILVQAALDELGGQG